MVGEVSGAIKAFFTWLLYERDPDKQARRAAARDMKYTKQAILCALKIFRYQNDLENLSPTTHNATVKRKSLKYKINKEKRTFYKLLAID